MPRRRDRKAEKSLALERIEHLLDLAVAVSEADGDRARRYVHLARRIGMRYQVPVPSAWRRRICRGCDTLLVAGRNARIRTTAQRTTVTCLACGRVQRYGLAPREAAP